MAFGRRFDTRDPTDQAQKRLGGRIEEAADRQFDQLMAGRDPATLDEAAYAELRREARARANNALMGTLDDSNWAWNAETGQFARRRGSMLKVVAAGVVGLIGLILWRLF
ncbi:hypothetical protein [Roseospirillum parvum]|uniref:Uncharacterized protein n=1 Tax=Roseospirillum parvum TaxID=83401 RepID=A0A1G7Z7Y0_9PROT|nr:hypothetical protein [Roseospirillum parvum]SDH04862.1 hypothetical protein SAMN05421742_10431 [Roseospirillum parvum]